MLVCRVEVFTVYELKELENTHIFVPCFREQLSNVWDHLEIVDILDSQDTANLALLARPELGITFTKIHCWTLTQYRKCVFLDADTLVVKNCDELFERRELSAVPDVGWPDCFNSGVFVFEPSRETHQALLQHAVEHGSFDGMLQLKLQESSILSVRPSSVGRQHSHTKQWWSTSEHGPSSKCL